VTRSRDESKQRQRSQEDRHLISSRSLPLHARTCVDTHTGARAPRLGWLFRSPAESALTRLDLRNFAPYPYLSIAPFSDCCSPLSFLSLLFLAPLLSLSLSLSLSLFLFLSSPPPLRSRCSLFNGRAQPAPLGKPAPLGVASPERGAVPAVRFIPFPRLLSFLSLAARRTLRVNVT